MFASESGSRAWGFESQDSDWDIRFVYVQNLDKYLSIYPNQSDVLDVNNSEIIKSMVKYNLDFSGWDIKKALYQISKGNPDLISWFYSPIIYRFAENAQILKDYTTAFFKPVSAYFHYLHMAKGNYNRYIKNPEGSLVNTKKYLYVIRPIVNCIYIEKVESIPPMILQAAINRDEVEEYIGRSVMEEIRGLIFAKTAGFELSQQERIPVLDAFIEEQIPKYENLAKKTEFEVIPHYYNRLDETFKQFAKGVL